MSEYEGLRKDLLGLAIGVDNYAGAVNRHTAATDEEIGKLWADNAELRDELNAVANRVESLTRAFMTGVTPEGAAEVAAAIVNDANRSTLREVRGEES